MLPFHKLQHFISRDLTHIIVTAGKTATQTLGGWGLELNPPYKDFEPTEAEVLQELSNGKDITFLIRHPADRYISGIKEIVFNHSLVDLDNILGRGAKTNIENDVALDKMLSYWHTKQAWWHALDQVINFWLVNENYSIPDFSINRDPHVDNWLAHIDTFINHADSNNLDNLQIVNMIDLSYYGAKEYNIDFPLHHSSKISSHMNTIIQNILVKDDRFKNFICPEQDIYEHLLKSKYYYRVDNPHPRKEYRKYEF